MLTPQEMEFALFTGLTIKIYALLTPPAVLSAYIAYSNNMEGLEKRKIALKTGIAIFVIGELLLIFGHSLFSFFGFTLAAFQIGVGFLLFLSAVRLMNDDGAKPPPVKDIDISIVPLAIPLGMGPATIGALMIIGASATTLRETIVLSSSLFFAACGISGLLAIADKVQKFLGRTGLLVLAKLTALLISAIAAQVIFTGIKAFFGK